MGGGYAWVTLATNNSYSLGALVLAHSLKKANTAHKLVVLITPAVSQPMKEQLQTTFDLVKVVDVLDSKDEAHLALMKRPDLGITFTKIHCWRLVEFEKCVFLDADTLVVRNCDELFEKEEFSAAPDVSWPDCFNSGVFVYRPSVETFNKLLQFAVENRSFDGGDQGLLNQFFSDWATEDIKKHLPFVYNLTSIAAYSYIPAFKHYGSETRIVHFIGSGKPWLQQLDAATRTVTPTSGSEHLAPLLQQWWDLFCEKVHPGLDKNLESSNDGMSQPPVEAHSNFLPIALTDEPQTALLAEPCTPYREKDDFRQHNLPYLPFHVKGPSGELLNVEFLSASVVPPEPEPSAGEQQRQGKPEESKTIEKVIESREEGKNEGPKDEPKDEAKYEPNYEPREETIEERIEVEEKEQEQEKPPPKDPFDYHSFFPDETCINNYLEKNVVTYQPFEHHEERHTEPEPEKSSPSLPRFLTIPQNDQRQSGNTDTHPQPEREAPARIEPEREKQATPPREAPREVEPVVEKRELSKSKSMSCFPRDVGTVGETPPRTSIWKSQPNLNVDPNRRYSMPRLKPILPKQRSISKSVPSEIPKVTLYTEFLISSEYKEPVDLPKDKIGFVEMHIRREGKLRRSKSDADISDKFGPLPYVSSPEVEIPAAPKRIPQRHFDDEDYDLAKCKRQMGNKPKPKDAEKRKEIVHCLPALKPIVPAKDKKSTLIKKRKSKELSPGDGGREKIPKRESKRVRERKTMITPRNVSTGNGNNLEEILQRLREFSKNYQHFFGVGAKPRTVTCKNATVQAGEEVEAEFGSSEPFETFSRLGSTRRSRETQTPKRGTSTVESSGFRQFRNYVKDQKETSQKGLLGIQDILSETRDEESVLNSIENKAPVLKGGACQKWESSPTSVRDGCSKSVKAAEKQIKPSKPQETPKDPEEIKTNAGTADKLNSREQQPNGKSLDLENGKMVVPRSVRSPTDDVIKTESPAVVRESPKDIPIMLQDAILNANNKPAEESVVKTTRLATTAQQAVVFKCTKRNDTEQKEKKPLSQVEINAEGEDSKKQEEIINTDNKPTAKSVVEVTHITSTPQQEEVVERLEQNNGELEEKKASLPQINTGGAKQDEIVVNPNSTTEEVIVDATHITPAAQQEEVAERLLENNGEQEEEKSSSHPQINTESAESRPVIGRHPATASSNPQKTSNAYTPPLLETKVDDLKNGAGLPQQDAKKVENGVEVAKKPEEILCVPDFETPRTSRVLPTEAVNGNGSERTDNSLDGDVRFFGEGKSGHSSSSPSPSSSSSPPPPATPTRGYAMSESFEDLKSKSGIAGAIAQLNLEGGAGQRPESGAVSAAHEEYLRRQNWETGNMDYMGRDSFDNIWSKICQTIEAKELEEKAAGSPQPFTETPKPIEKLTDSTEMPATLQTCPEYIETLPGEPAAGPVEDDEIIFSKPENRQSCLTNIAEEEEAGTEGMAGRSVKLSDILQGGSSGGQNVPKSGGEMPVTEKKVEGKTEGKGTPLGSQDKSTGEPERPESKAVPQQPTGKPQPEVKQQPEPEKTECKTAAVTPQPPPADGHEHPERKQPEPEKIKVEDSKPQPTVTETKQQPEPEKIESKIIETAPQPPSADEQKKPEAGLGGPERSEPPKPTAVQPDCKMVAAAQSADGQKQSEPEALKSEASIPQPTVAKETKPEAEKPDCKSASIPPPADEQKPPDAKAQPEPEKKAGECKTVAIPSPPICFPGSPFAGTPQSQVKTEEKKPEVKAEPIPLPPPETLPPQELTSQPARSESPKEEGKQKKGVFSKILEMVGVAPKEKNGSEASKSVFYDVEESGQPKPETEKKAEEVEKAPAGTTEVKESGNAAQPEHQKVPKPEETKETGKSGVNEQQEKPAQQISKPARSSSPKEPKQPSDSIQVSPTRKSPSPKLTIPPKLPETEVTMPTPPPPQPQAPPRRNSALLKVDETILETPPVVESAKEAMEETVKGKVTTEIEDIIGKAKSEVESLLQDRRSAEKEAGGEGSDPINTMKLLMGGDQPGKSTPEEVEELRVTTEEERKRHKGEVVTSKLSDQILKAIPPPRRKAFTEASASTSAIPKATADQKSPQTGESKAKPSKPSSIPVPPPRNRGKPATPAPPKPKGKK